MKRSATPSYPSIDFRRGLSPLGIRGMRPFFLHIPGFPVFAFCLPRSSAVCILLYGSKTNDLEITIHSVQIMPDHLHRFVEADPTRCPTEMVNRLKGSTSHFLGTEFVSLRSSLPTRWSRSYYTGTGGAASASVVHQ